MDGSPAISEVAKRFSVVQDGLADLLRKGYQKIPVAICTTEQSHEVRPRWVAMIKDSWYEAQGSIRICKQSPRYRGN
jgi:hypothetical protein